MDPSNYKVPKKQPINYGPKIKPKSPAIKPMATTTRSVANNQPQAQKPQPKPIQPTNKPLQQSPKAYVTTSTHQSHLQPSLKSEAVYTSPVKTKKNRKPKRIAKKILIASLIIFLLGLLTIAGYFGYKKLQDSKRQPEASNYSGIKAETKEAGSTPDNSVSPILSADYIVYGTKQGSLFVTNKSDYVQDPNVASVIVVAKSSYPNDNREITINQQKVASNFSSDPQGLKKIADSIGSNTPLTTANGTSYIITGNATGLTVIGATLISVRTSASLAIAEWQQIFNDLQPVQI